MFFIFLSFFSVAYFFLFIYSLIIVIPSLSAQMQTQVAEQAVYAEVHVLLISTLAVVHKVLVTKVRENRDRNLYLEYHKYE